MIDTNTYVSIMIGAIFVQFTAGILTLQFKENISRKRIYRFIYWEIISYGFIAAITTILYKTEQFMDFCKLLVESAKYINDYLLNEWYNILLPWVGNDIVIQNSFFQVNSLKVFYFVIVGIALVLALTIFSILIPSVVDFFDVIITVAPIVLFLITPITDFYIINVLFICTNQSEIATWILMITISLVLIFIFKIGSKLYEEENEVNSADIDVTNDTFDIDFVKKNSNIDHKKMSQDKENNNNKFSTFISANSYDDLLKEYAGDDSITRHRN